MAAKSVTRRRLLEPIAPPREICLELEDNSSLEVSASDFFRVREARDPNPAAARMAGQFVEDNRPILDLMGVTTDRDFDGRELKLRLRASNTIGAVPLISPTSAAQDFGLVIQPRFPWIGLGPMLAEMGWRIAPTPLRLPLLKRSERRVPLWVMSFMILSRLRSLLDAADRRFEITDDVRSAPRGSVNWQRYATQSLPRAMFMRVPCAYPDLSYDRLLMGAIRYSVELHLRSLETQVTHGAFVHRLIEWAGEILRRVQSFPIFVPTTSVVTMWMRRPLRASAFAEGLQAIEWTCEERGLAGTSDLHGIPWHLPMDRFFEAWVETVFGQVATRFAGQVRRARLVETRRQITWSPPRLGTQRALEPDLVIEVGGATLIVDAKYKRHWEELSRGGWPEADVITKESHRNDLLQVLAYSGLADTQTVIGCLTYPCSIENWRSLRDRGRLIHRAEIASGERSVHLWLTAVPMAANLAEITAPLEQELRRALNQ